MIVLKFGGSSVQSAELISRVVDIAQAALGDAPVLVASAMGKTTDTLIKIAADATAGNDKRAFKGLENLRRGHIAACRKVAGGRAGEEAVTRLEALFQELSSLVRGLTLIKECSPRTKDAILSFGELLSTTIIAAAAVEVGIETVLLDSRALIRTNDRFGNADVDFAETGRRISDRLSARPGTLLVAQGFIASNSAGVTTTLGRGGSDYTATIIGAAAGATVVEIWTDVDGIMTTDPRVIPSARSIPWISYEEAAELAYFGAKVVHPSTIQPAIEAGIPVLVKNTNNPEQAGTRIASEAPGIGLRAIAGKDDIAVITVRSSRMLNAYGFLSAIFRVFETQQTPVDLVATSEVSVSMTVDTTAPISRLAKELSRIGEVSIEDDKGIICLVGRDLWRDGTFVARAFTALAGVPVRMISLGSSDINLSLVTAASDINIAITRLHGEFF